MHNLNSVLYVITSIIHIKLKKEIYVTTSNKQQQRNSGKFNGYD